MNQAGITISNISKAFGNINALNNVSLHLEDKKIYGLLGRNGAGKTTLLNVISNRLSPDKGTVMLNGESIIENDNALCRLYFASEKMLYPDSSKAKEIFKWTKEFFPSFDPEYANGLAELFGLPLKKRISTLSTGYKSIFKNIIALSVNTPYVFLDEPVLGLDANHRELFYRLLIEKYSETPFTIVISTHLIEEAANLIENVIIIKDGEVITNEPKENLLSKGYTVTGPSSVVDSYIIGRNVIGTDTLGGLKTVYLIGTPQSPMPENLEVTHLDLQKLFIQLTSM